MRFVNAAIGTGGLALRLKALTLFACALLGLMHALLAAAAHADVLLRSAFVNWRAQNSVSDITMTVHEENWLHSMQMSA